MLSILIPIYNQDLNQLVNDLHQQGVGEKAPFEIVLADDGSNSKWKEINQPLQSLTFVKYLELPQNIGRSAIRNFLSENAIYDFLLFMDGDMKVVNDDFIEKYIKAIHPRKVTVGGLVYQKQKPSKEKLLHWKVGLNREVRSASARNKAPYQSFLSSNFMIPKELFKAIRFEEKLKQYGHEDTLFGMKLKEKGIEIVHIDNPLEHGGLESNEVFLDKTKKGIQNLVYLKRQGIEIETNLLSKFLKINRLGLTGVVKFLIGFIEKPILKNLKSDNPNLRLFDLYKLNYLIDIFRKEKN